VALMGGKQPVGGAELKALGKRALRYTQVLEQTEKKGDSRIIDAIVRGAAIGKGDLANEDAAKKAHAKLAAYLKAQPELAAVELELHKDAEHGGWKLVSPARYGGARKLTTVDFRLLDSPEYEELARIGRELMSYGAGPF